MIKQALVIALVVTFTFGSSVSAANLSAFGFKRMKRVSAKSGMKIRGKGFGTVETPTLIIFPNVQNSAVIPPSNSIELNGVNINGLLNDINIESIF